MIEHTCVYGSYGTGIVSKVTPIIQRQECPLWLDRGHHHVSRSAAQDEEHVDRPFDGGLDRGLRCLGRVYERSR